VFNIWRRSFTFNSNKSPTRCNNFWVYYPDVCLQLNMFRAFFHTSSGAQWLQWWPLVLFLVRLAGQRTQHDYHHDTKVKPEAATAVIELPMMGVKTPETCWAVNKRQDNKLKKNVASGWWFIWIVQRCTDLQTLNFTFKF
jgi:hypothetical protein